MHGNHSTLARRAAAFAAAAVFAVSAGACASAKKPAQQDTQAVQPDVARGGDSGRGGGRFGPGRGDARLFEGITLTDAQRTRVDSINASFRDRMMAARQGGGDRSQMRQMMQERFSAIRAVLTPDQQATFDKNVETMRSERGRRGPGGGPGGPGGGAGR